MFALVANIKFSISDPFMFTSNIVLSQTTDDSGSDETDDSGETGTGPDWSQLKLKVVDCKCPDGRTGNTAKCMTDGDKEQCSETQQGLTGCYSTSMFNPGELLCEGV